MQESGQPPTVIHEDRPETDRYENSGYWIRLGMERSHSARSTGARRNCHSTPSPWTVIPFRGVKEAPTNEATSVQRAPTTITQMAGN